VTHDRRLPSPFRRWIGSISLLVAVAVLSGVQPVAAQLPPGGLPATVVAIAPVVGSASYASIDYGKKPTAQDDRHATTTWRVIHDTGNCCENYVTATPSGRLLDFGGTYINYTDDRGLTWHQVQPLTPLVNGEGGIVVGLNGDVLGVGWDPYAEWSSDGAPWRPISSFTGRGDAYPGWQKVTLGFDSPGGNVQVRFRFQSDQLCSWAEQVFCSGESHGVRVDQVVLGRQA
jgi:hypothetical protein